MYSTNNKLDNNTKLTLQIDKLTHEGRGLAHHNGKAAFITAALPGETIEVTVLRNNKRQLEGFAEHIEHPNANRVPIKCSHFSLCGGCSLQHMSPETQIEHKQKVFFEQFAHLAQCEIDQKIPALTGPSWEYRHKARLSVRYVLNKNKICIGFRERNGRYIADLETCSVLHPSFGQKLNELARLLEQLSVKEHIPQLEVAVGDTQAAVIMRHLKPLSAQDCVLLVEFAQHHALHFYTQAKGLDSIRRLWPTDKKIPERLTYELPEEALTLSFYPTDFTQINPVINRKMVQQALDWLKPSKTESVLDLFCGLGNFTLPFARHAKHVVGVEMSAAMVARGAENALANGINNVEFKQADLSKDWTKNDWAQREYECVIFDPPRSGALEIVNHIHHINPQKIAYVSCHPATLARDANILVNVKGYRCLAAGVMDMFPHTQHVEAMAIFEKVTG